MEKINKARITTENRTRKHRAHLKSQRNQNTRRKQQCKLRYDLLIYSNILINLSVDKHIYTHTYILEQEIKNNPTKNH